MNPDNQITDPRKELIEVSDSIEGISRGVAEICVQLAAVREIKSISALHLLDINCELSRMASKMMKECVSLRRIHDAIPK